MTPSPGAYRPHRPRLLAALLACALVLAACPHALCAATAAFIRVNQLGYEQGKPARAYLMTASPLAAAEFSLVAEPGHPIFHAPIGPRLGKWGRFNIYALDFPCPNEGRYTLRLASPAVASPVFAIAPAASLYRRAQANALSYYQNLRDGREFLKSPLRSAPGHLHDARLAAFQSPPTDDDDKIAAPLTPTGATVDAEGGWTDAGGDYLKFVETGSYSAALMLLGVRDFPAQMGLRAGSSNFTAEAEFEIQWLLKMWDDPSRILYYQVGIGTGFAGQRNLLSDHDLWRLPQQDDDYPGDPEALKYIHHRPIFAAGPSRSKISPNLAGRLTASFAACYQVFRTAHPALADRCLLSAEHVYDLADTAPAAGSHLLTTLPWTFYPEQEWRDDLELGATELYLALRTADRPLPPGLPHRSPALYLAAAARWANAYMNGPGDGADTFNLYDVSSLAHVELFRALGLAGNPDDLEMSQPELVADLKSQLDIQALDQARRDPFGFGYLWRGSDTVSHGAGIALMALEYDWLAHSSEYAGFSDRWTANILGANPWGVAFITGDGATFPVCMQDQLSNLAGTLDGHPPLNVGAAVEGPTASATSGPMPNMRPCPANGVNGYAPFNANGAVYKDNVQSYSTNEPAQDLTAASFLLFAWKAAAHPAPLP